jgi:pimeloyl-ACP methyl ester carboxylesterase
VLNYDRRGRGDSGDTPPYAVEREVEDLEALIAQAGGSSSVFGYSSGSNLALKAAAGGLAISKLALYEPPFVVDDSRPPLSADVPERLQALISAGRRGDAAELYQQEVIGMPTPALVIDGETSPPVMRNAARAVAEALPNGQLRSLAGQGHDISPEATAPVLVEFLSGR